MRQIIILVALLSLLFSISAFAEEPASISSPVVCNQTYALCTFASCVPIPGVPEKSVCFCKVETGYSLGNVPCAARKPTMGPHNILQLYSNYSFADPKGNYLLCTTPRAWTFCLDKPCLVNPANPKDAVCTCDIKYSGSFYIASKDCNSYDCTTGLWSSANPSDVDVAIKTLMQTLGLKKSPITFCSIK